jgi:hypothetical protein
MSTVHARLSAAAVSCLLLACGQQQPEPSPTRERVTSQHERLERLVERRRYVPVLSARATLRGRPQGESFDASGISAARNS